MRAGLFAFLGFGRRLRVTREYRLDLAARGRGLIVIPSGYTWDGPTVGTLARGTLTASLVHDWLYRHGDRAVWRRRAADNLAIAIAQEHGGDFSVLRSALAQPVLALAWRWRFVGDFTGAF